MSGKPVDSTNTMIVNEITTRTTPHSIAEAPIIAYRVTLSWNESPNESARALPKHDPAYYNETLGKDTQ